MDICDLQIVAEGLQAETMDCLNFTHFQYHVLCNPFSHFMSKFRFKVQDTFFSFNSWLKRAPGSRKSLEIIIDLSNKISQIKTCFKEKNY